MPSETPGESTLEVTDINRHGIWLLAHGREFFLPHEDFPWFEDAKVKDILNVRLEGATHLYWPALDVDLSLEMLEHPERYPLISKR